MKNKGLKGIPKTEKEKIRQSKEDLQRRNYQRRMKTASWAKLKIRDEDGWNDEMRSRYYSLNAIIKRSILENDMTVIENRPKDKDGKPMTKSQVKAKNNYAKGIWSDSGMDKVLGKADELCRFIVEQDERKKENGFFDKNPKAKPVSKPSQINQHHLKEYITNKLDNGVAPSSVREYVTNLQKVFESTSSGGKPIKSHNSLMKKCSNQGSMIDIVKERAEEKGYKKGATRSKEQAIRNVGATDGYKGYNLEEAKLLIEHSKENPMVNLAIRVFTYVGTRKGALRDMVWSDVVDENGKVKDYLDFFHEGQMKGGRQQVAEVNEAKGSLERIYQKGGFDANDSVFGDISDYKLKKGIMGACDSAEIDYKANHAFRVATDEYYETEKVPRMIAGKNEEEQKEMLTERLLTMVNIEVVDDEGKVKRPHNRIINKTEVVKEYKTDRDGNLVRDKMGRKILVIKMVRGKDGNMHPKKRTIMDSNGQPVKEPKFTREKCMNMSIKELTQLYIAQQLSHNRVDANAPYQVWKDRKRNRKE